MRERPGIIEEDLRICLQDQYDLVPVKIEFLPLGLDYYAGVYRVVSEQGTSYLLKVTTRSLYEPGFLVPRYLRDQGIASVVAPLRTKEEALWTQIGSWRVILYPFVEGETSWLGMTNDHWKKVGAIFKRIHQVALPAGGFKGLREERFDPTEYSEWVHTFETQHLHAGDGGSNSERALRASWVTHQSAIHTAVNSLEKPAEVLQLRTFPYVICHADLHAANLIRDDSGRVFVIDWDEVMLAPKERDFIFVREPYADAFWEGYGRVEVDWMALTYFCWERVVQDVIVNAQDVCFRDDLGEETKAGIVQLFDAGLAEDQSNLAAAYAAAGHVRF
jgi:spectinomycin phosphotransferase